MTTYAYRYRNPTTRAKAHIRRKEYRKKKVLLGYCITCLGRKTLPERKQCQYCTDLNKIRYQKQAVLRKKLWQERKYQVLMHYSNGTMKCACLKCPEPNPAFLTIDHINGGGRNERRRSQYWKWIIDSNYPEGLQVLCMNCNAAKSWYGRCPHETLAGPKE